jgi:hypothetical protein
MIRRKIPHFSEIERNSCAYAWGTKSSLNRGIGCAPVTSVENTFLCGMQSSESSFIVTSTGSSMEDGSESYDLLILRIGGSFNGRFGFCDVPFGLSFLFAHHPSDNPARAKILDRTPCSNCQQLDRMCNWIANVTAWPYSSEPVLHLRIRIQHAAVAQGTNTHTSRSGQESLVIPIQTCVLQKGPLLSSPIQSIISPELSTCNKGRTSGGTPCALT